MTDSHQPEGGRVTAATTRVEQPHRKTVGLLLVAATRTP
jgi:hypothetical protein